MAKVAHEPDEIIAVVDDSDHVIGKATRDERTKRDSCIGKHMFI